MHKLRHLETAIDLFKRKKPKLNANMRGNYEAALLQTGWQLKEVTAGASYFERNNKRICIENGDRMFISFNGVSWRLLNSRAKENIILEAQGLELRR